MEKKYNFLISMFICISVLCLGKVLYLQTIKRNFLLTKAERQRAKPVTIDAKRGSIKSSDGSVLATSATTYNVYSDSRYIKDLDAAVKVVSDFFELDESEVKRKINKNYYVELVKGVKKEQIDEFAKIRPRGINFYETTTRIYNNNMLLGRVLGFTGNENNGLAGLELSLNDYLRGVDGIDNSERDKNGNTINYNQKFIEEPIDGDDATLTINYDIQYQMEKSIKAAVEEHKAKSGLAISMNPKDGSILGIAEYPTLDPNKYKDYEQSLYKSSALSMSYEPGSTFKPITVAIADATGSVNIEKEVFPDSGSYYIGKHRIGNWGKKAFGNQTAREILMNSSNVGTVQIAFKVDSDQYYDYLKKLGFGTKTGIELQGEQNSIMFSKEQLKKDINRATCSFGQGIAVTPLQLMKAWSIIINGGHDINPHILKEVVSQNNELVYSDVDKTSNLAQIIPQSTSDKVKKMLEAVVSEGTGKRARIPGYTVGGKTGTAQIVENGKYAANKYKVSFIGFAPVENPEVLTLVLLDSPESANASGGLMCAPTAKEIMEYSLTKLGVKPNFNETTSNKTNNTDKSDSEDEEDEEVIVDENVVEDYTYRLKAYVQKHAPNIPYEFEGEGDLIVEQNYVTDGETTKIIFRTEPIIKDGYITMPDLIGMEYNDFIDVFAEFSDKIIVNGQTNKPISVQDNKKGSNIDIKSNKITLWTQ